MEFRRVLFRSGRHIVLPLADHPKASVGQLELNKRNSPRPIVRERMTVSNHHDMLGGTAASNNRALLRRRLRYDYCIGDACDASLLENLAWVEIIGLRRQ